MSYTLLHAKCVRVHDRGSEGQVQGRGRDRYSHQPVFRVVGEPCCGVGGFMTLYLHKNCLLELLILGKERDWGDVAP